tara:strand:+ start:426 stop:659 length:234 start_codon:yes stop_codon:yes gene_type:complete
MDKFKVKEIIELSLKGSTANVDGSEGKYTAKIIFDGFDNLNTVGRHKIVYKALDEYIKSGELHAISIETLTTNENKS